MAVQRQRLYWVLAGSAFILILGLSGWFFYQSRQARKLAQREHLEAERLRLLTAGIAHEIKNPLNFVNNFAEGSTELSAEAEEILDTNEKDLTPEQFALLKELVTELKQNSVDIKKNGLRVNEIVRSMSDYASGRKSKVQPTALNDLVEEQINRAYRSYRAQHSGFDLKIEKKYDSSLTPVEIVTQDVGRVLLNIINNACDAMLQKQQANKEHYTPTLTILTASQNGEAVIRIRDNGIGIPQEVRDKIFTPFFTTKPTGTGNTGLGLAISYDIIVKDHHGKLKVESEPGEFTEFIIILPKKQG
ncbi:MAG: GHKL domain-containing protein [Saprospiraceae bacterium]|nr:GHKL domain-containing protein [Saprospiraceae bacterium]